MVGVRPGTSRLRRRDAACSGLPRVVAQTVVVKVLSLGFLAAFLLLAVQPLRPAGEGPVTGGPSRRPRR